MVGGDCCFSWCGAGLTAGGLGALPSTEFTSRVHAASNYAATCCVAPDSSLALFPWCALQGTNLEVQVDDLLLDPEEIQEAAMRCCWLAHYWVSAPPPTRTSLGGWGSMGHQQVGVPQQGVQRWGWWQCSRCCSRLASAKAEQPAPQRADVVHTHAQGWPKP